MKKAVSCSKMQVKVVRDLDSVQKIPNVRLREGVDVSAIPVSTKKAAGAGRSKTKAKLAVARANV